MHIEVRPSGRANFLPEVERPDSAHFFVESYVCFRAVRFVQLGRKPHSLLELHSNLKVLTWYKCTKGREIINNKSNI